MERGEVQYRPLKKALIYVAEVIYEPDI